MKDAELSELRSSAAAKARGPAAAVDVDLETIPDCVSLQSFRRKSSNSATLPAELRTISESTLCLDVFFRFLLSL